MFVTLKLFFFSIRVFPIICILNFLWNPLKKEKNISKYPCTLGFNYIHNFTSLLRYFYVASHSSVENGEKVYIYLLYYGFLTFSLCHFICKNVNLTGMEIQIIWNRSVIFIFREIYCILNLKKNIAPLCMDDNRQHLDAFPIFLNLFSLKTPPLPRKLILSPPLFFTKKFYKALIYFS